MIALRYLALVPLIALLGACLAAVVVLVAAAFVLAVTVEAVEAVR